MDKVSVSYIFFFPRYQTKCVIKFLLKQLMTSDYNFKIYLQSTSKATTGKGKKKGRWKKTFFRVFEGLSFGDKLK